MSFKKPCITKIQKTLFDKPYKNGIFVVKMFLEKSRSTMCINLRFYDSHQKPFHSLTTFGEMGNEEKEGYPPRPISVVSSSAYDSAQSFRSLLSVVF